MIAFVNAAEGLQQAAQLAVGPTKFKDVPASYWASGDINIADPSGYPDGTFKPDNAVTYPEALAMILRALGYTANYSWPYGVIAKATNVGITNGVTLAANATINRGQMAMLINNALDLDINKYDSNGNEVDSGTKLISKVGTSSDYKVVATNNVDSTVPSGYVEVQAATSNNGLYTFGGTQYVKTGSVDFNQYLGKVVTIVFDKSGNAVAASPVTTDVNSFTSSKSTPVTQNTVTTTSGTTYTYTFNDISVTVGNIPAVVDGVFTTLSNVYTNIDKGSKITLINNDGQPGYDYVVVTDATGAYVNRVVANKDITSSDKYVNNAIGLYDSSNNPYPVEGAVTSATAIKSGDVVYQLSVNGKTIIYVVRNSVTGTVSQVTYDGSNYVATINGVGYTLGAGMNSSVTANATGTATLDKNNVVIAWNGTSSTTTKYAVDIAEGTFTNAFNTQVQLALPDGTTPTYNAVYSDVGSTVCNGNVNQVVKYTINSSGNVDSLSKLDTSKVGGYTYGTVDTTNNLVKFGNDSTGTANNAIYYVDSSTLFFNVTRNSSNQITGLTPVTFSSISNGSTHKIVAVDLATSGYNKLAAVVFDDSSLTVTSTKPVVYVVSAGEYKDSSSDYTVLNVLENGVAKTYNATSVLTNVAPKQVYQLTLDANGKVTKAVNDYTVFNTYTGTISVDYNNNTVTVTKSDNTTITLPLDSNVSVIDSANKVQIGLGSIAATGSTNPNTVTVYQSVATGKVVVIVK
jgi:hypothetical protein